MWHLLSALSSEFRVRAFILKAGSGTPAAYPPGVEAEEIHHASGRRRRAWAALSSLAAGGAYSERLYRSARLEQRLARAGAADRPAWVVVLSYHLGLAGLRAGFPCWIDFQNRDSEIWARVAQTASSSAVRVFARIQAPRVEALERRLVAKAAGVSCASARDAEALAASAPDARPLVVPNGVDLSRYRFRERPAAEEVLFFVGDLSWPPNAEGVRWLRDRIWPEVKRLRPRARVEVLGRGAPRDLLQNRGDILFLEDEDTRPHWERAAVAIVPLLAGGGTRLKILEAAACGVPVVSTPVGAEGLDLAPGSEIAIAADAAAFAAEAARLLADPGGRQRQAAAARRRVEAVYDWRPIGAAFAREIARRSAAA